MGPAPAPGGGSWWAAASPRRGARWLNGALAAALVFGGLGLAFARLPYRWRWEVLWLYRAKWEQGLAMTVGLALAGLVTSTLAGAFCTAARRSPWLLPRSLGRLYVELVRGTPFLVQILVFFYVVAAALGLGNRFLCGLLALSVFEGAYLAEIFRAGLEGVAPSQLLAARSLGFTRRQTYRHIILPQAWRQILPPLAGQFASLIKDSSLLSVIAVSEFTLNAQEVNSNSLATFESFLALAVGYLALTLPISLLARALERRFSYAH